jgi:hypothetical protein
MSIEEIVAEMADTIRAIDFGTTIPVIEEEKGNVIQELEAALGKTSLCIVVGWNGFKRRIGGDTSPSQTPFGDNAFVAAVFENPTINRFSSSSPHICSVARAIANALDGAAAQGMSDRLHLKAILPISAVENGVVTCTVEFSSAGNL